MTNGIPGTCRESRRHIHAGLNGLVTTEDLLEELIGEIEDELDVGEPRRIKRLSGGNYLIDALLPLNDLEELLDVDFEDELLTTPWQS